MANQEVVNAAKYFTDLINLMGIGTQLPLIAGNVYYVHKGGDNAGGLSWTHAFTTIAAAIAVSNATISWTGNNEDHCILVAPGLYAENLTSLPYYCNLIGLGMPGTTTPVRIFLTGASAVAVTTMLGCRIVNIRFEADGAVDIFDITTLNDSVIEGCTFCANDGDVVNGLSAETSTNLILKNCRFLADTEGVGMTRGMYFGGGANFVYGDIVGNIITGCDPTGCGIYVHGDTISSDTVIRKNIIKLGGAGTGISVGELGSQYKQAIVMKNTVFHNGGDAYKIDAKWASQNIDNNNGSVVDEPNMG